MKTQYEKAFKIYITSFECSECNNSGQSNFLYDRTVANGECWTCKKCKKENLFNEEPREENFEEPMGQNSELDYQISVMKAKKEKNPILKSVKYEPSLGYLKSCEMGEDEKFNWVDYDYEVKPEPPKPKTVHFSFEDADFLLGLKITDKNESFKCIITDCIELEFWGGNGRVFSYTEKLLYQDPITKEWKPFEKVIE